MMKVALVVHHERPVAGRLAASIAGWLADRGHEIQALTADAAAVPALRKWEAAEFDAPELAISVGGDGTMLRTVHLVSSLGTPIVGVNMGHLGYLSEVEPTMWEASLERVLAGDYTIEERMTLDVETPAGEHLTALNDAVVEKLEAGHTIRVSLTISGQRAARYAADALIVATPTGSTAYNLSAGGPLVSPRLGAVLVTPVAAHSLLGRTLVVAPDEVVRIEVLGGSAVLGVDGRHRGHIGAGEGVVCRASATPARLISLGGRDFWAILKAKFSLDTT